MPIIKCQNEQLNVYLTSPLDHSFDVICLQETWLPETSDTNMLQIYGYKMINQASYVSSHGGLTIYRIDQFKYKILYMQQLFHNILQNSSPNISDTYESLFIEVTIPSGLSKNKERHLVNGNIYRPPRDIMQPTLHLLMHVM